MKRICLVFIMLIFGLLSHAQNISVKSFQVLPMDMTASSLEGKRIDQNNEVAALIKIVTTQTGFTFEAGALGIVDTRQEVGEVWVWVPRGSRKITIKHPQLGILRDYRYPIEIQAERTYVMELTTGKMKTYIEEETTEQWLVFEITPHDAVLEVDDKMWPVSAEGTARSMMPFGSYTYRVQAQNYHPEVGKVTVNDPENSQVVPVNLKPNFGWIEVPGDNGLAGAAVYVDNALVGKAPCKTDALKSGQHNVRILKEMYEPYTTTVTVNDNETTPVAPTLTADFAHLTLQVDADAEIWVNDKLKGTRTWTGDLPTGIYRIECKQKGHEATSTKLTVTNRMNGETVNLEAPIPIYGSLNVESTPDLATLYVDGKEMGKAPKLIGKILVGEHELRLSKDGYADYTETITITQGERTQVKATLSNSTEIRFTCNVPDAQLEIDGQKIGTATGTYHLTYGSHSIRATAANYLDYITNFSVTESSSSHSIQMDAIGNMPDGALFGKFSVSDSKKVYFAKGNLQYQASTSTWRFAEHQWDYIGNDNEKISSSYSGWIDLFGWGTGNNPTNEWQYDDNYSTFSDWGNKVGDGWRTLTKDEWKYVFDERRTSSGIRYAKATVNGVKGVILLPDDWSETSYILNKTNISNSDYNSNSISSSTWNATFAPAGAVFLPAAGYRRGTSVGCVGSYGNYWSASASGSIRAYYVHFTSGYLGPSSENVRSTGQSVRLVAPAEN